MIPFVYSKTRLSKGPLGIQGFSSGDYKDERHDKNVDMQHPSKLVQLHSR